MPPTKLISLTERQIQIVQSALSVVTPTGGGSEIYSVFQSIKEQTNIIEDLDLTMHLFDIAVDEYLAGS